MHAFRTRRDVHSAALWAPACMLYSTPLRVWGACPRHYSEVLLIGTTQDGGGGLPGMHGLSSGL